MSTIYVSFFGDGLINGALGSVSYFIDLATGTFEPGRMEYDWVSKNGNSNLDGYARSYEKGLHSYVFQQRENSLWAAAVSYIPSARRDSRGGSSASTMIMLPAATTANSSALINVLDKIACGFDARFVKDGRLCVPEGEGHVSKICEDVCKEILQEYLPQLQALTLHRAAPHSRLNQSVSAPRYFDNPTVMQQPEDLAAYKAAMSSLATRKLDEFLSMSNPEETLLVFNPADLSATHKLSAKEIIPFTASMAPTSLLQEAFQDTASPQAMEDPQLLAFSEQAKAGFKGLISMVLEGGAKGEAAEAVVKELVNLVREARIKQNAALKAASPAVTR